MTSRRQANRRVFALLAPATFFEGYDFLIIGLALPLIRDEFGLSLTAAGVVGSIAFAGQFGSLVLLWLADRWGRRPVLTLTIAGYTLATVATALSRNVTDFAVCQFIAHAFLGAEKPLATIVLVEARSGERRGRALGLLSSVLALGQAAAGLGFLVVTATGASWRWLYLAGVLPLVLVGFARRALPETMAPRRATGPAFRRTLRSRPLVGAALLAFLFSLFPSAVTYWISSLIRDDWGWNLRALPPAYLVTWALGFSGFFVAGRLLDRWGRRPTAAALFLVTAVAGMAAFGTGADGLRAVGLGLVIFGLTGTAPCMAAFATEPFPAASRGRVGAVIRVTDIGGGAVAPALVGGLAGGVGGLGWALALAGLSYALAAVVAVTLLPETRGVEPAEAVAEV